MTFLTDVIAKMFIFKKLFVLKRILKLYKTNNHNVKLKKNKN